MNFSAERMRVFPDHFFTRLNTRIRKMQARGEDVIRLDIGSPDLPPAPHIIKVLQDAAGDPGVHGYQPHQGPDFLRQAWAGMYQQIYQVDLDPENEVLPLMGSKEGIFNLILAGINPGELVLIPDPGYLTYHAATRFAGGESLYLPLKSENDFLPDLEAIPEPILERAKLLWLNYPNNPTAGVADLDLFTQVVELAQEHHLLICHDAAYSRVTYDGYQSPSILQVPGASSVAVEFNTLSKSHNMAGWRTGVVVGNGKVVALLRALKTNIDSGQFLPIMRAASAAMDGDQSWLADRNLVYQKRRDIVVERLHEMGFHARVPQASLYVWCPIPVEWSARQLADFLLEQAKISLTPGDIFGTQGEGYLRISLTVPQARIEEAMQRMMDVLERSGRW